MPHRTHQESLSEESGQVQGRVRGADLIFYFIIVSIKIQEVVYSFSLESITQHSWSPVRLLNFLTSVFQVTNREIRRDREDDT